jgi:hypothetical protein
MIYSSVPWWYIYVVIYFRLVLPAILPILFVILFYKYRESKNTTRTPLEIGMVFVGAALFLLIIFQFDSSIDWGIICLSMIGISGILSVVVWLFVEKNKKYAVLLLSVLILVLVGLTSIPSISLFFTSMY